jgi:Fatty acid hydroxylase superfamily
MEHLTAQHWGQTVLVSPGLRCFGVTRTALFWCHQDCAVLVSPALRCFGVTRTALFWCHQPCKYAMHVSAPVCHHLPQFPGDALRLVFPPLPAAVIAAGLYSCLAMLLPPAAATGVMAGVIAGYLTYDMLHYALHHGQARGMLRWRLLRQLRARHVHHHFRQSDAGYGITCPVLDLVLGTAADVCTSN